MSKDVNSIHKDYKMKILNGKLCYLTPFEDYHLKDPSYLRWLRDYDVIKTINRLDYLAPCSRTQIENYVQELQKSDKDIYLAIIENSENKFIGTFRIANINWFTRISELGVLIGEKDYWGMGIGKDAVRTASHYLFTVLGMRKLVANHMAVNPSMGRVFESLGFKIEGNFIKQDFFEGEYIDHLYYGCFKDDFLRKYKS